MTTTTHAPAITLDEQEAAANELIATMPADLVPLRNRKLALQAQRDELNAEIDSIKAIFDQRLMADGLQGYIYQGKVHARRSVIHTRHFLSKPFKETHPKLFLKFTEMRESVRITIN